MPLPLLAIAAGALAAKAGKSYFAGRAKKKQEAESNRANTAALNLQQKQREDQRIASNKLGASLLNGVPKQGALGINTNVGLDPALMDQLNVERTYDYGSAMPKPGTGAGSAFLSGLFGDIGDTLVTYGTGGLSPRPATPAPVTSTADANGGMSIEDLLKLTGRGAPQ